MRWFDIAGDAGFFSEFVVLADDLPRNMKPVMVLTGTDSKQTKETFARCCTRETWLANWRKHHGKDKDSALSPCPEVDFDSFMVVVIFQGKSGRITE